MSATSPLIPRDSAELWLLQQGVRTVYLHYMLKVIKHMLPLLTCGMYSICTIKTFLFHIVTPVFNLQCIVYHVKRSI